MLELTREHTRDPALRVWAEDALLVRRQDAVLALRRGGSARPWAGIGSCPG